MGKATGGLVQQQFGKMAGSVLNWTFGILINISAKLKVNASKSATSPSCKPLCDMLNQHSAQMKQYTTNEKKIIKIISEN